MLAFLRKQSTTNPPATTGPAHRQHLAEVAIATIDIHWALQHIQGIHSQNDALVLLHQLRYENQEVATDLRFASQTWLIQNGQSRLYNLPW